MTPSGVPPIIDGKMELRGKLHRIEDDLSETWVTEWAGTGTEAIEAYLAKHLAFLTYLDDAATA
jgi:hypothetical protein